AHRSRRAARAPDRDCGPSARLAAWRARGGGGGAGNEPGSVAALVRGLCDWRAEAGEVRQCTRSLDDRSGSAPPGSSLRGPRETARGGGARGGERDTLVIKDAGFIFREFHSENEPGVFTREFHLENEPGVFTRE